MAPYDDRERTPVDARDLIRFRVRGENYQVRGREGLLRLRREPTCGREWHTVRKLRVSEWQTPLGLEPCGHIENGWFFCAGFYFISNAFVAHIISPSTADESFRLRSSSSNAAIRAQSSSSGMNPRTSMMRDVPSWTRQMFTAPRSTRGHSGFLGNGSKTASNSTR